MTTFAERMNNNQAINTNSSSLPEFKGLMSAFNGQTGQFSLFVPGHFDQSEDTKSISFVTDFVMKRLKHRIGSGQNATTSSSNYIVGDAKTPYKITIEGQTYTGATKKSIADQMGRLQNGESLSQETIYVGYLSNKNGQALPEATPIWFVSRGTQMYNLNNALEASGGLSARTVITAQANGNSIVNGQGGTTQLLDFKISQLDDQRVGAFIKWAEANGTPNWVEKYRNDMFEASELEANATTTFEQNFQNVQIPSNATPSGQPQTVEAPNPFAGNGTEIDISDDDLPF